MWHRKQWPLRWGKRWRTSPLLFPSFFGFGNWSHTFRIDCSILEQIVGCQTVPCTGRFQFISSIWLYSDRRCRGRMFMNLVENVGTTPAQHHPWGPNWFTTVNGLNPINLSKLMKAIWPYYNIKIISEGADLRTYWTCQTKKKKDTTLWPGLHKEKDIQHGDGDYPSCMCQGINIQRASIVSETSAQLSSHC